MTPRALDIKLASNTLLYAIIIIIFFTLCYVADLYMGLFPRKGHFFFKISNLLIFYKFVLLTH